VVGLLGRARVANADVSRTDPIFKADRGYIFVAEIGRKPGGETVVNIRGRRVKSDPDIRVDQERPAACGTEVESG